jgi:Raf kinase inhibitor-like YbhB/YbcL family protein
MGTIRCDASLTGVGACSACRRHLETRMRHSAALLVLALPLAACAGERGFHVASATLHDGDTLPLAQVYQGGGCDGGNRSPALAWSGSPQGTRSYAVTMFDPDAPTGHGWWHWVAYDLPARTTSLPEGAGHANGAALPDGARQARNDFGNIGYGGACPPAGDKPHRYIITVYALPAVRLAVPASASATQVDATLKHDALASSRLTLKYGR